MVLLSILLTSCGNKPAPAVDEVSTQNIVDTLPTDFVSFFNQFHEDSAYQLSHINFPLEGLPATTGDGDTMRHERYFWKKENWVKHNRFTDPGGNFDHWYIVVNERIIEHWIQMKGTNLYMKRRFVKLSDGWFLIYYQGLRPTDPGFK